MTSLSVGSSAISTTAPSTRAVNHNLFTFFVVTVAWAESVLAIIAATKPKLSGLSLFADDALRLVQIRDLLGGQPWFDLTQYRIDPPYGLAMHWTRVVDGPIAILILFFRLIFDARTAETLAICAWPLLLLLPAWFAIERIATRLGGREAGIAALFLGIACVVILGFFRPGEIDHHNLQLVLTLWSLAFLIDLETFPAAAIGLAGVSALSLAVGLETMPYQLTVALGVSFLWVRRGSAAAIPVRRFGIGFAAAAVVLSFLVIATRERYGAACDTFSGLYITLAVVGGLGLAALTSAPMFSTPARRALAVAGLATVLFAFILAINPECVRGPYGMIDPMLDRIWLSRVAEVRSPFFVARHDIASFISSYAYAAMGLLATFATIFLLGRQKRRATVTVFAFTVTALTIASFEIRGLPFAVLVCLPGLAVAVRALLLKFMRPGLWRGLAMIPALLLVSNITFFMIGKYGFEVPAKVNAETANAAANRKCIDEHAAIPLSTLPTGRVAAFLDMAPAILLNTPDAVLAGMYHRDTKGILDTYRIFTAPLPTAARLLAHYQINYVVICRKDGDYNFYTQEGHEKGLINALNKGAVPSWLKPEPASSAGQSVQIYRVINTYLPH